MVKMNFPLRKSTPVTIYAYAICWTAVTVLLSGTTASGDEVATTGDVKPVPTDIAQFRSKVQPFLKSYCLDCHNSENAEAKFRVDNIDPLVTKGQDVERWEKVLEMISIGDMPPEDAESLPEKQVRRQIENWISVEL